MPERSISATAVRNRRVRIPGRRNAAPRPRSQAHPAEKRCAAWVALLISQASINARDAAPPRWRIADGAVTVGRRSTMRRRGPPESDFWRTLRACSWARSSGPRCLNRRNRQHSPVYRLITPRAYTSEICARIRPCFRHASPPLNPLNKATKAAPDSRNGRDRSRNIAVISKTRCANPIWITP